MNKNEFLVKLATANLDVVVSEVLPLINSEFAQVAAQNALDRVKETIMVLLDEDPENKAQLELIWGQLGSDPELVNALRQALVAASDKITDARIAAILKVVTEPVTKTIAALLDDVKPNEDQLKAIWLEFVTGEDFKQLVLDNLEWIIRAVVKNQTLEDLIVKLIKLVD